MAVSASDPAFRAEVTPQEIRDLGALLCDNWGTGPDAFGARGNLRHTYGYHRSRRYNQAHNPNDYSIQLPADRIGDADWVSAFDFTPALWGTPANRQQMASITRRMRSAAKARDPRVRQLREFAGTEDGRTVVTIDMQTGDDRKPFDSTHLDHCHGSIFRGLAAVDHTGIYEVMAGIPPRREGEDMKALVRFNDDPAGTVFLTDFVTAKWVRSEAEMNDYRTLHAEGALPLAYGGTVRPLGRRALNGVIFGEVPPGWEPPAPAPAQ